MKFQAVLAAGLVASANAHTIFQKVSVNGADKGSLVGLRAPPSNNPVYDVTSSDIICQASGQASSTIIDIPAGAKVGTFWGHVIGGAQFANDVDNPIAASHKGPISVYLAKVSNSATTSKTGLSWFKVAAEGFDTGSKKWAVDTMIQGGGWWYFNMPSCLASGNYLMRVELWGLHNAYSSKGAQFYGSCVNINISGGGSYTPTNTVSFPGAYGQSDPGILLNIYGTGGNADNGGKPYPIPGPAVISCNGQTSGGGGTNPTTTTTMRTVTTTRASSTTTTSSSGGGGTVALYGQCGGIGYTGPTTCASGTCKKNGDYYSQCTP